MLLRLSRLVRQGFKFLRGTTRRVKAVLRLPKAIVHPAIRTLLLAVVGAEVGVAVAGAVEADRTEPVRLRVQKRVRMAAAIRILRTDSGVRVERTAEYWV